MRKFFIALAMISTPTLADDQTHAEFWRDAAKFTITPTPPERPSTKPQRVRATSVRAQEVKKIVAAEAQRQLGPKWVNTAVRIAYVESRFNHKAVGPNTRHGRAMGVMQVMPATARALGYDPRRLHDAQYGAAVGVSHMKACITSGVRTDYEMSKCHVAGVVGWKRRLNPRAERYKRQYVAMVSAAPGYRD